MKKIFVITMLFLAIHSSYGQYFWRGWVKPSFPTVNDSIIIFDSVSVNNNDYRIDYEVIYFGDTILLRNCYRMGPGQAGKHIVEYANIGLLPAGQYYVKIQGFWQQPSSPLCYVKDSFFNELFIPFEVSRYPNGIGEATKMEVSLFPNPTNDWSVLRINSDASEEIEMILADISGKVVMEKKLSVHGEYSEKIDLRNYSTGIYALSLKSKKSVIHFKIIKL